MKRPFLISLFLAAFACFACASPTLAQDTTKSEIPAHKIPFIYYLQSLNKKLLTQINPAVAVIDPYDSGLEASDIAWLKQHYGQTLIAYLSVGEADPGRTGEFDGYKFHPEWLSASWLTRVPAEVKENTQWATRRVEYWHPQWRAILSYRIKVLAELGYDGAMFDTVDSYLAMDEYYRRDLRQDMADLIGRLQQVARAINPDFKIFINGGMELYTYTDSRSGKTVLELIDGQLKEDTWYNERGTAYEAWTNDDIAFLRQAIAAGKPVFAIDYFTNAKNLTPHKQRLTDFMTQARNLGAIPFAADRSLGKYLLFNEEYYSSRFNWDSAEKAGIAP